MDTIGLYPALSRMRRRPLLSQVEDEGFDPQSTGEDLWGNAPPSPIAPPPMPPERMVTADPRMARAAPVRPDIEEAMQEGRVRNPQTRATELGLTPAEETALAQRIDIPTAPQREQVKRGGFLGTLKSMGKGFLQSVALADPQASFGETLGRGFGGAVRGGISPQNVADVDYNAFRMPRYRQEAERAQQQITAQQRMRAEIAKRTGFDPVTGEKDPERERQEEDRTLRRMQIEGTLEQRKEDRMRREQADRERVAATAVQRAALLKQPVPKAAVMGTSLEALGGTVPPPDKDSYREVSPGASLIRVDPRTGEATTVYQAPAREHQMTSAEAYRQATQDFDAETEDRGPEFDQRVLDIVGPDVMQQSQMVPESDVQEEQQRIAVQKVKAAELKVKTAMEAERKKYIAERAREYTAKSGNATQGNLPRLTKKNARAGQRYTHDGQTIEIDSIGQDGTVHYHQVR